MCAPLSPFVQLILPSLSREWQTFCTTSDCDTSYQQVSFNHTTAITSSIRSLAQTGLPSVGEAVPQALAVTPEQPVEDAVKEPVQVETFYVRLPPDPLQC